MLSTQLGYVIALISQHVSTSNDHLQVIDINYIKRNIKFLIMFRTDISILQIR